MSDQFAREAERCTGIRSLEELLEAASRDLGFSFFALLHHASCVDPPGPYLRIDNYPEGWRQHFLHNGFGAHDPVHFASRRAGAAFRWSDLDRLVRLDPRQRHVFESSRAFGIGEGFTVPVNIFGEPAGSCSFALATGRDLPAPRLGCAALIGSVAFDAARRLSGAGQPSRTHLSRREAQCVRLVAAGKTDWEVAMILGLSEDTVRQYVKRARSGYDVVSRTQLVLRGLADGWLD